MSLYHKTKLGVLFQGDCISIMKSIPSASVDSVICDLPFFRVVKNEWDNSWKTEQEYLTWLEEVFTEYKRLLKPNGNLALFTGRQLNRKISIMLDNLFIEKRIIIWHRNRMMNNTRGKALTSSYEPICYYVNSESATFNNIKIKNTSTRKEYTTGILKDGTSLSDVWSDIPALPHNSKEKVKHPTQKPERLIERLVTMLTNEGNVVLDNCSGSGTLGIVCNRLNRKYVMIEKEIMYCEVAKDRLVKVSDV